MTRDDLYQEKIRQLEAEKAGLLAEFKSATADFNATIASLKMLVETLKATIESLQASVHSKDNAMAEEKSDKEKLENQIRGLGKLVEKKSEQSPISKEAKKKGPAPKERGNNGAKRCDHPEAETEIIDLEPNDPEYNILMAKYIGVTEVVRYCYLPGKIVKKIYREKAYKQGERIFTGLAPAAFKNGSNYDASVLAGICQLRYEYSMPVERIVKLFTEWGFSMPKPTAYHLLKIGNKTLARLYNELQKTVLANEYQNWDETYHCTLTDENERGSRKGYLWEVIGRNSQMMFFHYDKGSRSGDIPKELLKGVTATLQSDAYAGYKNLGPDIKRITCMAHLRRYFKDVGEDKDATYIIERIDNLYHNDYKHRVGEKGWTTENMRKWREKYAPPILKEIKQKLLEIKASEEYLPKSLLAVATKHMLSEWEPMEAIFSSGNYDLDNNLAERYNRYIALSRKNSMFFGSHAGAERAAMYYSIICSCLMQEVDVLDYLTTVIKKVNILPEDATDLQFRNLLPDMLKPL